MLANKASLDVISITGSNLRNIQLLVGKTKVEDIKKIDSDSVEYFTLKNDEAWKVSQIKEIMEARAGKLTIEGFNKEELDDILEVLCTD